MPILSTSPSARLAIIYVTVGALVEAWSIIWYRWLATHPPTNDATWYLCYGFILTGIIVFFIGLTMGWIGRSARKAELPPSEATKDVAQAEKNMAARAPVAAANPSAAGYVAGQPVVQGATMAPVASMPAVPVAGQPVVNPS
jgi:hypothetical protein